MIRKILAVILLSLSLLPTVIDAAPLGNNASNTWIDYFQGNVGIGVIAPAEKLEVAGNVRIGTDYYSAVLKQGLYPYKTYWYYEDDGTDYGPAWIHNNTGTGGTTHPTMFLQTAGNRAILNINDSLGLGPMILNQGGSVSPTYPGITRNTWISGASGVNSYFNNNANVGIGTTTPTQKLYVQSGNIGVSSGNAIGWGPATTMTESLSASGDTNHIAITTNSVERLRIVGNGDLGIGTSSPAASLHVTSISNPEIHLGSFNNNTGTSSLRFNSGTAGANNSFKISYYKNATTDRLGFIDGGNIEALSIKNGGNVGLGDGNPAYGLVINNPKTTNTGAVYINAGFNHSGKGLVINSDTRTGDDNNILALELINRAGGNTLAATVEGKVGIGTTSPEAIFNVVQPGAAEGIRISRTGFSDAVTLTLSSNTLNNPVFGIGHPAAKFQTLLDLTTGNLGIDSLNPAEKLSLNGNLALKETSAIITDTPNWGKLYAKSSKLYYRNDSGQEFDLTASNIGTTGATTNIAGALTVAGNASFSNGLAMKPSQPVRVSATGTGLTVNGSIMRINSATDGTTTSLSTANPQISTSGIADGQILIVKGKMASAASKVEFFNGRGALRLASPSILMTNGATLTLMYDAMDGQWIEISRSINE